MLVIEATSLAKKYGNHTAVTDVSFAVQAGQVFGFLGANGSGKTTTIGMLLGVTAPTGGTVSLFSGTTPRELWLARRRIGATLEAPCFSPYLSGLDNLRLVARIKSCGADDVTRVLGVVGLVEHQRRPFRTYSLGMKQRLAIGGALLGDPDVIILDEPTNGLDPEGVREIRELIDTLAGRGKTVFLSSHLLSEVERVCTHVAVLARGRVVATGGVAELLAGGKRIEVRCDDVPRFHAALGAHPDVISIVAGKGGLILETRSGDPAGVNRFLADRGLYPSHLAVVQRSMEDVFFGITDARNAEMAL